MKVLQKFKNLLKVFSIKEDKAIYTCLKNNIPLTDENIKEVMEILKQRDQKHLLEKLNNQK